MKGMKALATLPARAVIRAYQLALSPWLGGNCRFHPTCSAYALEALARHGLLRGGWLALRRIGRCHPWGGSGADPVPAESPLTTTPPAPAAPAAHAATAAPAREHRRPARHV